MTETNDICGHVVQNAKDINDLQWKMGCQNEMINIQNNCLEHHTKCLNRHRLAGMLTCASVTILGLVTLAIQSAFNRLTDRVNKLEEEKEAIDIPQEE